ncbi:MAG TPA: glucoamylase family protein [Polyangiaceae bacterium]
MAARARAIASKQRIAPAGHRRRGTPLLERLNQTRRILDKAYARLARDPDQDIGPAGEWLLDNYHVVLEHVREVRESLPRRYYRELPELTSGPLAGYPRVYELSIALISHTEGRIDLENVDLFSKAFQEVVPLAIGELWAMPAMLRLGLIENVRRMALRTVQRLDQIEQADEWAVRIDAANEQQLPALAGELTRFISSRQPLTAIFVSRFLHQLRLSPGPLSPHVRLEQWIGEEGMSAEEATSRANQRLAHTQLMMANSITSLRAISHLEWRKFVERQSGMQAELCHDPAGVYARMLFSTRDQYRHVVERIAKRTGLGEHRVARQAVELARASESQASDPDAERRRHVGYYLLDAGLPLLEQATKYRPGLAESIHRWVLRRPNLVYVGGVTVTTLLGVGLLAKFAEPLAAETWSLWPITMIALMLINDVAISSVNQLITAFLPPRPLPKLDLREEGGIPPELRTTVVVPTLLANVDAVRDALDNLEMQYLSNRGPNVHFALLSDFTDSDEEVRGEDAVILQAAALGMRALNARYGAATEDVFYLLHRVRRWNEREGVFMGWERKRGKLREFNQFLRGADGAFSTIVGNVEAIRKTQYVITLDSDTLLPPDAAALLVGTLAHPLNRAFYDPSRGRVVRGYGIVQPRVVVSLQSAHRSQFAAIYSGHPGVDPYTVAVSDVYQDLYGEGSFTGKGVYDVDAFEQATSGRFPENTLLSHDLIEGNFARAGLATDIVVYDDYPASYATYTRRKHRWIRGDWQLLAWLKARVPGPSGLEPNQLSTVSLWKILDNLRRSLLELTQLAFLVAVWTVLPGSAIGWTALGIGFVAAPWLLALLLAALRPPFDKSWWAYYAAVGRDAVTSAEQVFLAILFLPHQAYVSADAIARTCYRLLISRRRLLEWQTAEHIEKTMSESAQAMWRAMLPGVLIAIAIAGVSMVRVGMGSFGGEHVWQLLLAELPLLALWVAAPQIAHELSARTRPERRLPRAVQRAALRYALLHWRFFERFVTAETHWLAPDNFQEAPTPTVAMRTSPTNIGLQLLSTVSAYDLGFITLEDMLTRLERACETLERMRGFRGHLYNWYDLHDLRVLEPAYISTVDSGNLVGHLIALRQACSSIADDSIFDGRAWRALDVALELAASELQQPNATGEQAPPDAVNAALQSIRTARAALSAAAARTSDAIPTVTRLLESLVQAFDALGSGATRDGQWITWALRLVEEYAHRLSGVSAEPAPARDGEMVARYPSWRRLAETRPDADALVRRLEAVAARAYARALGTDFKFLYDDARRLFAIGYQESSASRDASYYDLLASEARLTSFIAIAKDDVPVEHWFRLGRTLTHASGATALVSWSGSMFEYLMPALVMRTFSFTLLEQTQKGAVRRQISYGVEHGVPWGVSESAYNLRDRHLTYQYRAFGVPDLGLKRGLGRDLVIAPYATALASMTDPKRALANLGALEQMGMLGPYGFRDALDYTRPSPGERCAVVQNYMAHHVGMSLVALTNALTADSWPRRFHSDVLVRSVELLLQERIPRSLLLQQAQVTRSTEALPDPELEYPAERIINTQESLLPHVALLGHLPYTLMLTECGGGYSRYEQLAVTRWRADATRDHTGQFCYIKDLTDGRVWSSAHQPVCAKADQYCAVLATHQVTYLRVDGDLETRTEVVAVPADGAEVRRVTLTNNGDTLRELELTSYGEIVLALPEADRVHPAFGNLFVETEWHEWCSTITATRRPRSAKDTAVWCAHVLATDEHCIGPVSFETDRARFLGRGRGPRDPLALETDGALNRTTGAVLDPIFALRTRVRLKPGQAASVTFTTLVTSKREDVFKLADRYHDPHAAQRALDLSWTATQVELRELNVTPANAGAFQELAAHLFFSFEALRASDEELRSNHGSQAQLWANGISGDWPILLATIDSVDGIPTLRELFAAHHYWQRRGMMVDLVVLNTQPSSYLQTLNDGIMETLFASGDAGFIDQAGGVFVRRRDQLAAEDLSMLRATARVHVNCDGRTLTRILAASKTTAELEPDAEALASPPRRFERRDSLVPPSGRWPRHPGLRDSAPGALRDSAPGALRAVPQSLPPESAAMVDPTAASAQKPLAFHNGIGGVAADGAYEIHVQGDHLPPAPWANVIANPHGGFIVTERGGGFTWAKNSYFYRLTPWHNDPVSDPPSEVLYLRDEDSSEVWSATPAPIRNNVHYRVRHSAGRSSFESEHADIAARLVLGMARDQALKISVLSVTNRSTRTRHLTITAYAEWTLGVLREHTQHQVQTSFDPESNAILAQNYFEPQFGQWVAFAMMSQLSGYTADRREFLGRNGSLSDPAALRGGRLSETTGAGIDPCAALQSTVTLEPGETLEISVLLGAASDAAQAQDMRMRYRTVANAKKELWRSMRAWAERLSVVTVRTPEPQFDTMLNQWTLYQALACRMWARSALYQSSGAYGFRDQLQDVMAFVYAEPALAREHILRAAARQFIQGDVQHWWHPESGRGVRTKFSDDLVWLPYVVDHFVRVTGDASLLDEVTPFLHMRELEPHEHEVYDLPQVSDERASVYEHCVRALRRACTTGVHGLPLIGSGDWNDGMSRVGAEGRGESVWLCWFLISTLRAFALHAEHRGDSDAAADFRKRADAYAAAAETNGWDGQWYRRAYFDDGEPLGSASSDECRIDAIAQSWSVISGAASPERQIQAMSSFEEHLVREDARLLMLLTPPFDKTSHDPGYIKGYLPGVRENGAQYTHAALWSVLAAAIQRKGDRAFELYQMLNPLTHASTPEQVATYKVEPYVVAADVYTAKGQLGRGGWTWYTGSASWMYRVGLEAILGFTKRGDTLSIDPCVPSTWPGYTIEYRYGRSLYTITVVIDRSRSVREPARSITLDGRALDPPVIPLIDDEKPHAVRVEVAALAR